MDKMKRDCTVAQEFSLSAEKLKTAVKSSDDTDLKLELVSGIIFRKYNVISNKKLINILIVLLSND